MRPEKSTPASPRTAACSRTTSMHSFHKGLPLSTLLSWRSKLSLNSSIRSLAHLTTADDEVGGNEDEKVRRVCKIIANVT
jgi:hypothetical protein